MLGGCGEIGTLLLLVVITGGYVKWCWHYGKPFSFSLKGYT